MSIAVGRVGWVGALGAVVALIGPACGGTPDSEDSPPPFDEVSVAIGPSGGGGTGGVAAESTCDPRAEEVLSLEVASRNLSWALCRLQGFDATGGQYILQEGQRELSAGEVDSVADTVAEVHAGGTNCGADEGIITLDVRSGAATHLYMSCANSAVTAMTGRQAASGVRDVASGLLDLSGQ